MERLTRDAVFDDPANEGKPYISQKLEEAFICSGERDALCVRALGYYPLWFNSETQKITSDEIKEIMKYVKRLYNIPDIDSTGIRKGTELALEFCTFIPCGCPNPWDGTVTAGASRARTSVIM